MPQLKLRAPAFLLAAAALILSACSDSESTTTEPPSGRTVNTVLGRVEVPAVVDSVVVLEGRRDLDIALSLDLNVVGIPYEEEGALELKSPVAERLQQAQADGGAKEIFLAGEVDLEAVMEASPDLIISRSDDVKDIHTELKEIAPVLAVGDQTTATWQDDLRLVATATGTEDRAEELIAAYDQRVARVALEYADILSAKTFTAMNYNDDEVGTRSQRLLSLVLRDVGVRPSTAFQTAIAEGEASFSLEQTDVGFGDADGIIVLVNSPDVWREMQEVDLYRSLPAVANGHVIRSDKQTHEGAALTAMHCLNLIEELLLTFR